MSTVRHAGHHTGITLLLCWFESFPPIVLDSVNAGDVQFFLFFTMFVRFLSVMLNSSTVRNWILRSLFLHPSMVPLMFYLFIWLDDTHLTYKHNCIARCSNTFLGPVILHIASRAAHTTLNIYKPMEISIKRSPHNTDAQARDRTRNFLLTSS